VKSLLDLQSEASNMRKKMESMEMKQAAHLKTELMGKTISVGKYSFIGQICEDIGPETLRKLTAELRAESANLLLALAVISEGKPFVVIGIGDQLLSEKNLDASKLIRELVTPKIKGGGGGQKTLASAGGQDAGALESILTAMKGLL
jgi:alanyl-tRNA synthetase